MVVLVVKILYGLNKLEEYVNLLGTYKFFMSGHSKWSTIKRQKGVTDARRGAAFTKAANAITIAAKSGGGGDPESNFKLRLAVDAAKTINMPKDNINRAINRITGDGKDVKIIEEIIYEGFGPSGVGVLVEVATDNRQRSAQEVRAVFDRGGGRLAGPGSVVHLFSPVGEITIQIFSDTDEDQLLMDAAESGADDVETDKTEATVFCQVSVLESVKSNLSKRGLKVIEASVSRRPNSAIKITDEKESDKILSLVNKLDDLADVQKVYANFDIPEEYIKEREAGNY